MSKIRNHIDFNCISTNLEAYGKIGKQKFSKIYNYIDFNFISTNLEAYGKIDKQQLSKIYNYIDFNLISTNLEAYGKIVKSFVCYVSCNSHCGMLLLNGAIATLIYYNILIYQRHGRALRIH